jgi:hypothetical protein
MTPIRAKKRQGVSSPRKHGTVADANPFRVHGNGSDYVVDLTGCLVLQADGEYRV